MEAELVMLRKGELIYTFTGSVVGRFGDVGGRGIWSVGAVYLCFRVRRGVRLGHCHFFSVNASRCCCSSCRGRGDVAGAMRGSCVPTLRALVRVTGRGPNFFGITFSVSKYTVRLLRGCTPAIVRLLRRLGSANYIRFLTRPCSRNLSSLTGRRSFGRRALEVSHGMGSLFNRAPGVFQGSSLVCSSSVNDAITSVNFGNIVARNTGRVLN